MVTSIPLDDRKETKIICLAYFLDVFSLQLEKCTRYEPRSPFRCSALASPGSHPAGHPGAGGAGTGTGSHGRAQGWGLRWGLQAWARLGEDHREDQGASSCPPSSMPPPTTEPNGARPARQLGLTRSPQPGAHGQTKEGKKCLNLKCWKIQPFIFYIFVTT